MLVRGILNIRSWSRSPDLFPQLHGAIVAGMDATVPLETASEKERLVWPE
jgi:hypothetical protein